ncbi:phosphatase PAP2 family protein [Herbiconiux sp. VKM Ac-1786]|jgi:undecaprenyl-diphosphatase|uniref:phosphatase PAP2 family protein n=1 Tax=Herbiconiux sp. VKM Ac-1786 TaxID=2783824 RepID=UPI00188BA9F0|nr:phosphatase PAP2 family protein [Herbiconiux sp. VKM Ac-1786]MBF4572853.1 phosphatase PAP2 family protein [Herbiconiux sp. VKM Ac-1786]
MSDQPPPPAETLGPPEPPVPYKVTRRWPVVSAIVALLVAVLLGVLVVVREQGLPFGIDEEWMDEILENRTPILEAPSLAMNYLGGGILAVVVIPLIVIALLLIFRRPWAALFFTISIILSAAVVQVLKTAVGRPRPEDMLVVSDFGSFPSGHSANAATLAVVLGIVFARTWIWVAGSVYTLLMMASRTYLGAHWLTDTIGGLLLGAGVAALVWAPFAAKIYAERVRDHRPVWNRSAPPGVTGSVRA